jgi:ribosomal protein S18 acetylase RimI-like enzyme
MILRPYHTQDQEACLEIFKSNCPLYFDPSEFELFKKWLLHQNNSDSLYQSPTYQNAKYDQYFVIENTHQRIVACGGYYVCNDTPEARLAWGMVHADFHNKGYGSHLYQYRKQHIQAHWPNHVITLGTSQHTYAFYEKMGMQVTQIIREGYGEMLDRYDMQEQV